MAELIATPPATGTALPFATTGARLEAVDPGPIHSIAPWPGAAKPAVAGLAFPAPGRISVNGGSRLAWAGRDTAFLIGAEAPDVANAAVTDQSDAWAALRLSGPLAPEVLARLVPIDLRPSAFGAGQSARSLLGHMPLLILGEEGGAFLLLTFRSMVQTATHELIEAIRVTSARGHSPR